MVFKRYIKKNDRKLGPYYYKSYRDRHGKVIKKYLGKNINPNSSKAKKIIFETAFGFLILGFLIGFCIVIVIGNILYEKGVTGRSISDIPPSTTDLEIAQQLALNSIESNVDVSEAIDSNIKEENNEKVIEFLTNNGNIILNFDLLNYGEWLKEGYEEEIESNEEIDINGNSERYKWGYNIRLNDLNFMARIDVSADENIVVVDQKTLKIGNNYLSFSDLEQQGYIVRVEEPVIIDKVLEEINETQFIANETNMVNQSDEELNETIDVIVQNESLEENNAVENSTDDVENNSIIENENNNLNSEENEVENNEEVDNSINYETNEDVLETSVEEVSAEEVSDQSGKEQSEENVGELASVVTGFVVHGIQGITGLMIQDKPYSVSVYIQKDFLNSGINVGDTINLDPTLVIMSVPTISITSPEEGSYKNASAFNVVYTTGDSPDNCYYTIDGGSTFTPADCGTDQSISVSISGETTVTVYANNSDGEASDSITVSYDDTAPTGTGLVNIADQWYNSSTWNSAGIYVDYTDNCYYSYDGSTWNSITCGSGNNIPPPSNDGSSLTLYAMANDSVGNSVSSSINYLGYDDTPPSLSEFSHVTNPTNDNTPSYTFTTNEAGIISCDGGCYCSGSASVGDNPITIYSDSSYNGLVDGTYSSCNVYVTDAAGNSGNQGISEFVIDTSPPTITINSPITTTYSPGTWAPSIDCTDASDCNINSGCMYRYYRYDGWSWVVYIDWTNLPNNDCDWSTIPSPGIDWAQRLLEVKQNDNVGNTKVQSSESFTWDETGPAISITTPVSEVTYGPLAQFIGSVNFGDASNCYYSWDNSSWSNDPIDCVNSGNDIPMPTTTEAKTLFINATDSYGNPGYSEINFYWDETVPVISITSPADGSYRNTSAFNVAYSPQNSSENCFYSVTGLISSTSTNYSQELCSGSFSITISENSSIIVYENDSVGNTGQSSPIIVYYDNEAPSLTYSILSGSYVGLNANFIVYSNEILTWCGLSIDSGATLVMALNENFLSASYTVNALSSGSHSYVISCNDSVGNLNTSDSISFTSDSTIPLINFTAPTPANGTSQYTRFIANVSSSDSGAEHSVVMNFNNSLVGWWRFNSEEELVDSSGNGLTLTNNGATATSSGKYGAGYLFNKDENDYISLSSGLLDLANGYTISAWVKPTSFYNYGNIIYETSAGQYGIIIFGDGSWQVQDNVYGSFDSGTGTLNLDEWQLLTITYNENEFRAYKNGNFGANRSGTLNPGGSSIQIGAHASGGYDRYFSGYIDDVQIYNRALETDEINALYNANVNQYYNNFTGLSLGNYTIKAYAQDLAGNVNETETRTIGIVTDTSFPLINYGIGSENQNEIVYNNIYVNVSWSEANFANITFNLYNTTGGVNSTFYNSATYTNTWYNLTNGNYKYQVNITDTSGNSNATALRNITLIPSCLDYCAEGGSCNLNRTCTLYSGLCTGSVCNFANFTINSTLYTLHNSSGDSNNIDLNLTGIITFKTGNNIIFSGKNGSTISPGTRGGNAGIVNITVPNLFNTTSAVFTGRGGYSTLTGISGGNGGILWLNYKGLFGDIDLFATNVNTINGTSISGLNGTSGYIYYNKDLTCSRSLSIYRDVDLDNSGVVDLGDIAIITDRYNNISSDSTFNSSYDINCDNKLNVIELAREGFEYDRGTSS